MPGTRLVLTVYSTACSDRIPSRLPSTKDIVQRNPPRQPATCGCIIEVDCNVLVLFGAREAGCFREMAALHSDQYRQASPLYL